MEKQKQFLIRNDYYNKCHIIESIYDLLHFVKVTINKDEKRYNVKVQVEFYNEHDTCSYSFAYTEREVMEDVLKTVFNDLKRNRYRDYSVWERKV